MADVFAGELQRRIAQGSFLFGLAMGFGAGCGDTDPTSSPSVMAESAAPMPVPADNIRADATAGDASRAGDTRADAVELPAASPYPAMTIVASLGYPRDLLDRGRVNIEISRDDDTPFVVLDKQLVADHFAPAPIEQRRSALPGAGSTMALQTEFGEVADCLSPAPVSAALRLTFLYDDDPEPITAMFPLTDATTLDRIRLQSCLVRQVLDENEVELRTPRLGVETMRVDLVITRRSGDAELRVDAIKGTVLFGASSRIEADSPRRTMLPDDDELVLPLTIDVNRCDPHAVAETTRKYGLEMYVSLDGSDAQRLDVDVEAIVPLLDEMLAACAERTSE